MKLEDLQTNESAREILPDSLATVVSAQWFGSEALEITYKDPAGQVANQLLYRHDEPRLEVDEHARPWSFDGEGQLFRLVSEETGAVQLAWTGREAPVCDMVSLMNDVSGRSRRPYALLSSTDPRARTRT